MALFAKQLQETLLYYQDLLRIYQAFLQNAPEGRLICQRTGDKDQYYHVTGSGDGRIRQGINKHPDMQKRLAQKEFAKKAVRVLERNVHVLSGALQRLSPFDPDEILRSVGKGYARLPEEYFFNREKLSVSLHLSDEEQMRIERHRAWGQQAYEMSEYRSEMKVHKTSEGLNVRSKSEALILERLRCFGIDTRYEQTLTFGDEVIAPDFTFEGADGKLFYLEHLGMMDDERYARRNYNKLMKYYRLGLILGNNLILSFDRRGTIDMTMIDFIIRNEIIPRL